MASSEKSKFLALGAPPGRRLIIKCIRRSKNLTGQADTAKQILKSGVAAQRIVDGVYLESS